MVKIYEPADEKRDLRNVRKSPFRPECAPTKLNTSDRLPCPECSAQFISTLDGKTKEQHLQAHLAKGHDKDGASPVTGDTLRGPRNPKVRQSSR